MQSSAKIKVTHILTDSNIGGAGRLLRYQLEKADRERFYRLCRKYGYDCTTIKNESRRNHPDF